MSGGGVKVAVRTRPFNQREKDMGAKLCIAMNGPTTTITNQEDGSKRDFAFDYSFWSHDGFQNDEKGYSRAIDGKYADQQLVFDKLGKEVLDNAWGGYHCCLFAYGQTGSGKSYSMIGYGANKGIVPIATEEIFKRINDTTDGTKFQVNFSMLEIYNEKTQDLMINPQARPQGGLKIRQSKLLGVYVENLTKHPVDSYQDIEKKMALGTEHRTVGSTLMNATSSRAHTIIQIEFKQITEFQGRKGEKLSVINLVDLAGSEKAGQTGATGDRLKEGCMINQSLTSLGQVISTLADIATGKAKPGTVIPYRNSALTRILQNALGGNSKTIMICAVSPATVNYEESMSTLRYADRAKKIKNKAEINESPQDKLIRELKAENELLKKKLASGGGGLDSSFQGSQQDKVNELQALLAKNQEAMEEMQADWQKKLAVSKIETEKQTKPAQNRAIPHLTNLHQDPQFNGSLYYNFEKPPLRVGRKNQKPPNDIIIGGIGVKDNHAQFEMKGGKVTIKPCSKQVENLFVNGQKVTGSRVLQPNDRIVFGTNSFFIFRDPEHDENAKVKYEDIDLQFAQREKMEVSDQANKAAQDEAQAQQLAEMKKKLEEKQKQLEKERLKADEEIAKKRKEMEEQGASAAAQAEIQRLEEERARKETEKQRILQQEQEDMERRAKEKAQLEQQLAQFLPLVHEADLCSAELKRKFKFSAQLQTKLPEGFSNPLEAMKHRRTEIVAKVDNKEDGYSYIWPANKFKNRLYIIRDIVNDYFDSNELPELDREKDPFWDPPEPHLIGTAYANLENLSYLIENEAELSIIGLGAGKCGSLQFAITPCGQSGDGEPDEDILPESPEELIGQRIDFNVVIKKAKDLPFDLCNDVYVNYEFFIDDDNYQTDPVKGHNPNPVFNYKHHHSVDMVTKSLLDYLSKSNIAFKVYGYSSAVAKIKERAETVVKKAAKPIRKESIKNQTVHPSAAQSHEEHKSQERVLQSPGEVKKGKTGCCTIF